MQIAVVQDKTLPLSDLDPAYLDRGTMFGDGVYEVLRSYNGKLFALEQHLQRLQRSLSELRITGVDIEGVRKTVIRAFRHADIPDAIVYFHITRGSAVRSHAWQDDLKPNFLLTVTEAPDLRSLKEAGVSVVTHPDWRWKRCDIKSLNLLANTLAKNEARRRGAFEAVLVGDTGCITEGASSAFFMVRNGKLVTRPLGHEILPSVTRAFVLQLLPRVELELQEQAVSPEQALTADELFLASSTRDIVPIVNFDGQRIGDGRPGPHTRRLMAEFRRLVGTRDWALGAGGVRPYFVSLLRLPYFLLLLCPCGLPQDERSRKTKGGRRRGEDEGGKTKGGRRRGSLPPGSVPAPQPFGRVFEWGHGVRP